VRFIAGLRFKRACFPVPEALPRILPPFDGKGVTHTGGLDVVIAAASQDGEARTSGGGHAGRQLLQVRKRGRPPYSLSLGGQDQDARIDDRPSLWVEEGETVLPSQRLHEISDIFGLGPNATHEQMAGRTVEGNAPWREVEVVNSVVGDIVDLGMERGYFGVKRGNRGIRQNPRRVSAA
jgi:hypothetical protein